MSYVTVAPEMMASAASDLAGIGSTIGEANAAAAVPTAAMLPPAADEVSAAIAGLFSRHAQQYQVLAGQVATFHNEFTNTLLASANSYLRIEATNASAAATLGGDFGGIFQSIGNSLVSELVGSIPGLEETELFFDAIGPLIVTTPVLERSGTAILSAVQTGNFGAATAALVNAPASLGGAFLYGQDTVPVPLSLPGGSVTAIRPGWRRSRSSATHLGDRRDYREPANDLPDPRHGGRRHHPGADQQPFGWRRPPGWRRPSGRTSGGLSHTL